MSKQSGIFIFKSPQEINTERLRLATFIESTLGIGADVEYQGGLTKLQFNDLSNLQFVKTISTVVEEFNAHNINDEEYSAIAMLVNQPGFPRPTLIIHDTLIGEFRERLSQYLGVQDVPSPHAQDQNRDRNEEKSEEEKQVALPQPDSGSLGILSFPNRGRAGSSPLSLAQVGKLPSHTPRSASAGALIDPALMDFLSTSYPCDYVLWAMKAVINDPKVKIDPQVSVPWERTLLGTLNDKYNQDLKKEKKVKLTRDSTVDIPREKIEETLKVFGHEGKSQKVINLVKQRQQSDYRNNAANQH
ncbi:MAG: hypothetical protein K0R25_73 [Rickettsiaceae bacterium]|jgi:hypothetical protein|nr:hypothetical protein [Rickettsiaceae bacterium]